jgi:hypothetical protein
MKNILKYFSFFIILNFISCDDGYNNTQVNVIGSGIPLSSFKAVLGAPENNRTCFTGKSISETKSEVTFKWSDQIKTDFSEDRYYYILEITDLNINVTKMITPISRNSTVVVLDKGTPYSWRIITQSNTDESVVVASELWKFYLAGNGIVNYVPFPAQLKTPVSGSTVSRDDNDMVTFSWEGSDPDVGDTLSYTLFVDALDGEQIPPNDQSNLSSNTLKVKLNSDTIYYWRIETSDGKDSSYSLISAFRTK